MDIYLPVAEMSVNLFWVLGLGGVIGFLSGLFGVGGGFLMTPMLILMGIPPAVAVGTQSAQILASSVSGVLANIRRKAVDFKMGWVLVAGGMVGSIAGVALFRLLVRLGQIDVFISLAYVLFLGTIGMLMFVESLGAILRSTRPSSRRSRLHQHYLDARLAPEDAVPGIATLHQHPDAIARSARSAACSRPSSASVAASSWCRR